MIVNEHSLSDFFKNTWLRENHPTFSSGCDRDSKSFIIVLAIGPVGFNGVRNGHFPMDYP